MSSIKAIEGRTVHQIQSGQVIVDLCSVVKELVENSLDAGATSIDVRFKNSGLQAIEVQDNGDGISSDNYESIALKHYTSKLSTYADLTSLQTFGFRGEAISSLCAVATVHIITAQADEAPKGTVLEFEISGKLRGTSTVASQKGTTVVVENLFSNLPVRRRELEKNIKREYSKVLGVLNAYACISTGVKFSVSNHVTKGKKAIAFATKANPTTRENISNVFGAKTLTALVPLDLKLELQSTTSAQKLSGLAEEGPKEVRIIGHISRPVFGEGRQLPDRQMFFVNSRPCGLPQVAKAFNEVYKSYNISQSPFIFADLRLDTNGYDVNVSPDKRTILLHDQNALLESLKTTLTELFESTDQTVPQTQGASQKLPSFKQLTINRASTADEDVQVATSPMAPVGEQENFNVLGDDATLNSNNVLPPGSFRRLGSGTNRQRDGNAVSLIQTFMERKTVNRVVSDTRARGRRPVLRVHQPKMDSGDRDCGEESETDDPRDPRDPQSSGEDDVNIPAALIPVRDFNRRIAEQEGPNVLPPPSLPFVQDDDQDQIPSTTVSPSRPPPGLVQSAFNQMRPKRTQEQTATVTIGLTTIISPMGTPAAKRRRTKALEADEGSPIKRTHRVIKSVNSQKFGEGLRSFAAPGTQTDLGESENEEDEDDIEDNQDSLAECPLSDDGGLEVDTDQDSSIDERKRLQSEGHSPADVGNDNIQEPEESGSDGEYFDDVAKKAQEDQKVQEMIQKAEAEAIRPSRESLKRADTIFKGARQKKDSITQLEKRINTSMTLIEKQMRALNTALESVRKYGSQDIGEGMTDRTQNQTSAEERLSLTVSKEDFSRMRVVGQFNLGFIIALRPAAVVLPSSPSQTPTAANTTDDVFIIDQHASDEKYNFERLQSHTVVQSQPLVRPLPLSLTAVEEEILLEHLPALEKNGFLISIDQESAVGHRCHLLALPMSKEVVFGTQDLEELIGLLADSPVGTVPRPTKVRRMFAMRACRSSVMIGKTLTPGKMQMLVRHMGEIEKPWNCPHGRPTMRHLLGLGGWRAWEEGDGVVGMGEESKSIDWQAYVRDADGQDDGDYDQDMTASEDLDQ